MKGTLAAALVVSAVAADVHAKPPPHPSGHQRSPAARPWVRAAPALPMLPSVARVRIEAGRDRVVVVEEINLPRGDWQSGSLDPYIAFGEPGTPLAVDAHLVAVPRGAAESRPEEAGVPIGVDPAIRWVPSAQLLLGRAQMAGVVVHVKAAELRRVYQTSDVAALRIRSLLSPPAVDTKGVREVVVRLGIQGGLPLTLGSILLVSAEPRHRITRAEATLCGPEADPWPLALALLPKPDDSPPLVTPFIAPPMAVRHSTDDLCVRWWAAP